MNPKLQIVILEDNPADAGRLEDQLRQAGYDLEVCRVRTESEFVAAISSTSPNLVVAGYALSQFDAPRALTILLERHPEVPFIVIAGQIGEEKAVELIKGGATDLVSKDKLENLGPSVQRALREVEERNERRRAELQRASNDGRFRALFDSAGAGIAIESLQGQIHSHPTGN